MKETSKQLLDDINRFVDGIAVEDETPAYVVARISTNPANGSHLTMAVGGCPEMIQIILDRVHDALMENMENMEDD